MAEKRLTKAQMIARAKSKKRPRRVLKDEYTVSFVDAYGGDIVDVDVMARDVGDAIAAALSALDPEEDGSSKSMFAFKVMMEDGQEVTEIVANYKFLDDNGRVEEVEGFLI